MLFQENVNVHNILLPNSLKILEANCFQNCNMLSSIDIPQQVKIIPQYCFQNDYQLTQVNLPKMCIDIDNYAFQNCNLLMSINIPDNVQRIGQFSFANCTNLSNIIFGKQLITIEQSAFSNCSNLETINLGNEITTLGQNAFYNCNNLKEIHINRPKNSISGYENKWGATNATIYWAYAILKFSITPFNNSVVYVENIKIDNIEEEYKIYDDGIITYEIYNPDFIPLIKQINIEYYNSYNIVETLTKNNGVYITINPSIDNCTISIAYNNHIFSINRVLVKIGDKITYTVQKKGYRKVVSTIQVLEEMTINVEMQESSAERIELLYPFEENSDYLNNLIDGNNFFIDNATQQIASGSRSYHVNNGTSYGYIEFTTPEDESLCSLSITGYTSSESGYDWGGAYIGTAVYQPSRSEISNKTLNSVGTGQWIFSNAGNNSSQTYTVNLLPNTHYYLSLAYAKDGSSHSNSDRLFISNIVFYDVI